MLDVVKRYLSELKEDITCLTASTKVQKPIAVNPSLLSYLPYKTYDLKHQIFENDKSLGFMLRVSHFSGMNNQAKQALKSMIENDMPHDCVIEVINYASPRIGDLVDHWFESGTRSSIFEKIAQNRKQFFMNGAWNNILGKRKNFVVRDFELFFCFSISKSQMFSRNQDTIYKLENLKDKIIQALRGMNCAVDVLNDRKLASFLQEIINPSLSLYKSIISEKRDNVKDYLISNHNVEMTKDGVVFESDKNHIDQSKDDSDLRQKKLDDLTKQTFKYLIFEITNWPSSWRLENSIDMMGRFDEGKGITCPFYISYKFKLFDRAHSERSADRHRVLKTKQGDSKLPMFFPKMIEEIEDWRHVCKVLDEGARLGKTMMQIVACTTHDEDKHEQIIKDHFARLGFRIEKVKYDTLNSLIYSLPFGSIEGWNVSEQLKIPSQMTSNNCMSLLPIFADTQNYGSPLMMFAGKLGQIFFFDNFKTSDDINGNFNTIVVGGSGTGKSVWIQEYTAATLRFDGQVVILDDGRSFENSCNLLGGDFIDFRGKGFCINPFSLYQNMDESDSGDYKEDFEEPFIDLIVSILCIIINLDKNDNVKTEVGLYRAVLTNVVTEVINKKGRHGGFSDIRQELLTNKHLRSIETKHIADKIEYILRAYDKGRYAKYYNGEANINLNNRLTVFEFSDLEHNKILQHSVILMVIFLVYSKMQKRERRTPLIIDEAWKLLNHPAMKEFIEGIARRARKYNGCLIVATQRMADFDPQNSLAAAAALSQSDWRVLLSVERSDEEILKKQLGMNEAEIEIASSLSGLKGSYSEFMLRHKNRSWQIGRLILDPFSAKLYSTKAEEVFEVKRLRVQGLSLEEAIDVLLNKERLEI